MVSSMSISMARGSSVVILRPLHFWRQRGQDRIDITAGLEAEDRAPVIEQIEFDIAAAADQLLLAILGAPRRSEIATHQRWIDLQEGAADVLREGKIGLPIATVEPVIENAADAPRFLAVRQIEIFV